MQALRLDRIISNTGMFSRSEAAALIRGGRVAVNGLTVSSGSEKFDPESSGIFVDGKPVKYSKFHYIMLNKPCGFVSSTRDKRDKTVMELLDAGYRELGLFPAGRLDKDAEGLLILTNDGGLAHEITSPVKKIDKRYFVQLDGNVSNTDIETFEKGVILGLEKCMPAKLEAAPEGAIVTVCEGRYHQVKRMMAAVGKPVKYIKRIAIGGLKLDECLAPGEYRELGEEINEVFRG